MTTKREMEQRLSVCERRLDLHDDRAAQVAHAIGDLRAATDSLREALTAVSAKASVSAKDEANARRRAAYAAKRKAQR